MGAGEGDTDIYKNPTPPAANREPWKYPENAGAPGQTPGSDDILTIRKTSSEKTVIINGMPHRLFIYGFVPNADGNCPAAPPAGVEPVATFVTKENRSSFGCMYGSVQQERYVRVAKAITEDSEGVGGEISPFTFTTRAVGDWAGMTGTPDSTLVAADGFVADGSFSDAQLTPTGYGAGGTATSSYKAFVPGQSTFVIAETGPVLPGYSPKPGYFGPTWETSELEGSPVWAMTDVTCLNGVGERVNVTRDATTGGVDFSEVAPASSPAALPITCTFTNQKQSPNLRLDKSLDAVEGGTTNTITVTYRITATNDGNVKGPTGRVVDRPDFAPGLTVQSARITTEPENIDQARALPATENYVLTEGTDIEPGASLRGSFASPSRATRAPRGTGRPCSNAAPRMSASFRATASTTRSPDPRITTAAPTTRPVRPLARARSASRRPEASPWARPTMTAPTRSTALLSRSMTTRSSAEPRSAYLMVDPASWSRPWRRPSPTGSSRPARRRATSCCRAPFPSISRLGPMTRVRPSSWPTMDRTKASPPCESCPPTPTRAATPPCPASASSTRRSAPSPRPAPPGCIPTLLWPRACSASPAHARGGDESGRGPRKER